MRRFVRNNNFSSANSVGRAAWFEQIHVSFGGDLRAWSGTLCESLRLGALACSSTVLQQRDNRVLTVHQQCDRST
jgi:hypothetical protein